MTASMIIIINNDATGDMKVTKFKNHQKTFCFISESVELLVFTRDSSMNWHSHAWSGSGARD